MVTDNSTTFPSSTPISKAPIVILFGWVGSHPRLLQKYASVFSLLPVVQRIYTTTIKNTDLFAPNFRKRLYRIMDDILQYLQQQHPGAPIIFGYFSNGGAFLHEQLLFLLQNNPAKYNLNIVGTFFDSAPAWLSTNTASRALTEGIKNRYWRFIMYSIFYVVLIPFVIFAYGCKRPQEYFTNLLERDNLACPSLYIYSDHDTITDSVKLQEFIHQRQQYHPLGSQGIHILHLKKSKHVGHLLTYPEEYRKALDDFVKQCVPKL